MKALPEGLPIALDGGANWFGDVLVGGSPRRAMRLTPDGRRAVEDLCGGRGAGPAARALGRRLVDAGIAHPEPAPWSGDLEVTVIVPVRDRPDALDRCLSALGDEAPVTVVDDASGEADRIAAVCAAHGAALIRRDRCGGPAAARNEALAGAETELVAFCDSDCEPPPGWLRSLTGHFSDPLVGAIAPRILPPAPGPDAGWFERFVASRSPLDMGSRPARVMPGGRIRYVPSAALMARREALGAGFDRDLRFGEDVDLVWRLHDAGWRIRYEPEVVVRHAEPGRAAALLARRYRYGTSAGALARRHPGRLDPAMLPSPRGFRTARDVTAIGVPRSRALAWSLAPAVRSAAGLGRAATSLALPLVAAGLIWRRTRPAAAALLAASALDTWARDEPSLDPLRWTLAALADDAAYGAGVWRGCLREGMFEPIRPRMRYMDHGGCSTRTLSGSASRDAPLRRSSAWRLAGANALQANQRPKARWSTLGPLSVSLRARIAPPSSARPR